MAEAFRRGLMQRLETSLLTAGESLVHSFRMTRSLEDPCNQRLLNESLLVAQSMDQKGIPLSRNMAHSLLQECVKQKDASSARQVQALMSHCGLESVEILGNHLIRLFGSHGGPLEVDQAFAKVVKPSSYTWSAILSANVNLKRYERAFELYHYMQLMDVENNRHIYMAMVKACTMTLALPRGRLVHEQLCRSHLGSDIVLENSLLDMYAKCGNLQEAQCVFNKLEHRDLVSWGAMIAAYVQHGSNDRAFQLFEEMLQKHIAPDRVIFLSLLKACARISIEMGRFVHNLIIESRFKLDLVLNNTLVYMYSKCDGLDEAYKVFGNLSCRDAVSWGALIAGYVGHGHGEIALELFEKMEQEAIMPERATYISVLKACRYIGSAQQGKLAHNKIIECGLAVDFMLGSSLVDMYIKCGCIGEAHKVFDKLSVHDVVTWSALIGGYAVHGFGAIALDLFGCMQQKGIKPDKVTFLNLLKGCASIGAITPGRLMHNYIMDSSFEGDLELGNMLVDMYTKCGGLDEAELMFCQLQARDVVSWGTMIGGFARNSQGIAALELFNKMQAEGLKPERASFLGVLKACGDLGAVDEGRKVHEQIIRSGSQFDLFICNALIDMYAKCGNLEEGRKVFDNMQERDIISWGGMIEGYAEHGSGLTALTLFEQMQEEKMKPDRAIFLSILKACGDIGAMDQGLLIHKQIIESGLASDSMIGNMLVHMYGKWWDMQAAQEVFNSLQDRDVVSWGIMIAGYIQCGNNMQAKQCFEEMQQKGISASEVTFTSILSACSHTGVVDEGCQYFNFMREVSQIMPHIKHYNCMIDLLARAGRLQEAQTLLQSTEPTLIGWMSLLTSCRTYGNLKLGELCFDEIVKLDSYHASGYALMSNIYTDSGLWKDGHRIEELRRHVGAWKKPAMAWIELNNKVHEFIVGDNSHPQSVEIYAMLQKLNKRMKEQGYMSCLNLIPREMPDKDKEGALCGHCEKLAVAYGLISTPQGTAVRVSKNLRVCVDCHNATKIISKIEGREIVIKDAYRVHRFKDGMCACGDYY